MLTTANATTSQRFVLRPREAPGLYPLRDVSPTGQSDEPVNNDEEFEHETGDGGSHGGMDGILPGQQETEQESPPAGDGRSIPEGDGITTENETAEQDGKNIDYNRTSYGLEENDEE